MVNKFSAMAYVGFLCAAILAIPTVGMAQDTEDDAGNYFSISTYTFKFSDLDDLYKMMEEDMDIVEKNEFIISQKVMTHIWAPGWTIVIITEHKEFGDVLKAQSRGTELYEEKYPNEKDREARDDAFSKFGIGVGHVDAIVQDNPKLSK